ncbi:MAG: hypothetical protein ACYC49_02400 [Ignavibacteriaceae bacterium]
MRKNLDNFKSLFENFLFQSNADFVLLFTDDAIIYDNLSIPSEVLDLIKKNPSQYSYKAIIGQNVNGSPKNIKRRDDFYYWNYYDKNSSSHWAYPFAVDATLYYKDYLLSLINKVLYQSPITLEAFVVKYVKIKKKFNFGFSPLTSKVISITINRVSNITNNFSIDIDVNLLKNKFLEGYKLEYKLPSVINQTSIVPDEVSLIRGSEKIILFNKININKE